MASTYNVGIHRYHRYITLSGHFFGVALLLCQRARFDAWPLDLRQTIAEVAHEATAAQWRIAADEDDHGLAKLRPTHKEITQLTDAERALFTAVAPVVEEQRLGLGDRLFTYLAS